ncbi:MAG TPA: AI-2E family transporter [Polyangia bacterium]|nr:AI-2E family transporter [Polyangia bacterium]
MTETNPEVRRSQVTLKTVFTVCFGVLLVAALVLAVSHSLVAVTLSATALLLAIALNHVVVMLTRRRVSRPLAIAIVMLSVVGAQTAVGFTIIPPAVNQGKLLVTMVPGYVKALRANRLFQMADKRMDLSSKVSEFEKKIPELLEGAAAPILSAVGGILSLVAAAITIFFLTVFMLIFGGPLVQAALHEARPERRAMYRNMMDKIYQSVGGYVGGLILICSINATLTTIFLAINGVPFFLPLGIISGLSSTVPYAGPFLTGTGITLLSLVTDGPWHGLASAAYFVAYGQLEGNVLGPLIFRRTVHVNPLVVTLSVLFLGEIGGIIGAIVAVPVVAAFQIILREVLRVRREQLHIAKQNGDKR